MSIKKQETDYSQTLFLPQTNFAMRAALPQKEPIIIEQWQKENLYQKLREKSKNCKKYILHDGPPYANGNLHIGHALNKILKDVIVRSKQMQGFDSPFVPGWDCHGLPIEWRVEEEYRNKGKNKDEADINEFRAHCREFAKYWVKVQTAQFQRFGILADFENPYLTMNLKTEAIIAAELLKFAKTKQLYRGSKPIMWSVTEKTALAEAEIEYHNYESDVVWVKFPISLNSTHDLADAFIVIWTTTPWTIPTNRAVSYNSQIEYSLFEVIAAENDFGPKCGEKYIFADKLANIAAEKAKISIKKLRIIDNEEFLDLMLMHPFANNIKGYDFSVPLLDGEHVTNDAGTGFVHTAPSHGREDFEIWAKNEKYLKAKNINTDIVFTVDDDGYYTSHVPFFGINSKHAPLRIIDEKGKKGNANRIVIEELIKTNNLFARGRVKHSYPHSWRSKKPLISRNTPQWFIAMDKELATGKSLRTTALEQIEQINFKPKTAKTRLSAMIKDRPDWVLSRQRSWGVPICLFIKEDGTILEDEAVNQRILEAFAKEGADAWFKKDSRERFLGDYAKEDWQQVTDILDVWFDSGSSHSYVLDENSELYSPADLYFEGSDQHRGWFQSSILESCATKGVAPYKNLVTHGFTLDEQGKKMSKSLGNVVDPQIICDKFGADILRLWVMTSDYCEDQRVGEKIIQMNVDYYRKLRNVIRWMLGTLSHYDGKGVEYKNLPSLEKYMLHNIAELDVMIKKCYNEFDFKKIIHRLVDFAIVDLSAFYFDIRKDSLYCDAPSSARRQAALDTISIIFEYFNLWLAPMLVFTTEEAWQERYNNRSIHLKTFLNAPDDWVNDELEKQWQKVRKLRKVVTGALELERTEKTIGSSLEAKPIIYIADKDILKATENLNMADICITSDIEFVELESLSDTIKKEAFILEDVDNIAVKITKASGNKCMRSWRYTQDVGSDPEYPDVSLRDAQALRELKFNRRENE